MDFVEQVVEDCVVVLMRIEVVVRDQTRLRSFSKQRKIEKQIELQLLKFGRYGGGLNRDDWTGCWGLLGPSQMISQALLFDYKCYLWIFYWENSIITRYSKLSKFQHLLL